MLQKKTELVKQNEAEIETVTKQLYHLRAIFSTLNLDGRDGMKRKKERDFKSIVLQNLAFYFNLKSEQTCCFRSENTSLVHQISSYINFIKKLKSVNWFRFEND